MIEHSEPQQVHRPDLRDTIDIVHERRLKAPSHIAFRVCTEDQETVAGGTRYRDICITDFCSTIDAIATRLVASGFQAGECAAIMAPTSYQWALAEWAIWRAGGIVVPIYETSPFSTLEHICHELSITRVFISNKLQLTLRDEILSLDGVEFIPIDTIETNYRSSEGATDEKLLDSRHRKRDDVASVVYTSGTTGKPQGTRILHRNFIDLILNVQAAWRDVLNDSGRTVIFLPLAHVLARGLQMICIWAGMRITYMSDPRALIPALPELQPTFLVAVPRVFQKILDATRSKAREKHMIWLWNRAERTALAWGKRAEASDFAGTDFVESVPLKLRLEHKLFDILFYSKVRDILGGSMEFILSGAAPLNRDVSLMFRGFGLPVMEGYGLTETTAPLAGNRPGRIRSGSVGELIPGTTVRIAEDGSILVKGIGVAPGYLDPRTTASAYLDGFFNTGDIGELKDSYLYITGRAKDMLVTAGGKTISPARWESLVTAHPLIEYAIMIADDRPYPTALLILDNEASARWASANNQRFPRVSLGQWSEVASEELRNNLKRIVHDANSHVSRAESVKDFRIISMKMSEDEGLVTPTMKIKRAYATKLFSQLIDNMYRI
ncbi:AMP-dependent synthetase/ligase [Arcanobacterium phocae]|uniref:AMP-dependent synthetase/ligase n=1 Tax=Arcanobacterium phocae TaxID=131112 RepID=UPI001C0EA399|nr:AMP-dependent synthetase/ligase [Arcanobacterium phocae]